MKLPRKLKKKLGKEFCILWKAIIKNQIERCMYNYQYNNALKLKKKYKL